eukprot:Nitzschia sp. Nitz4//scaffold12_size214221//203676//204680//NITZ4_001540-RA/size214221-processed-gene-0.183-mRNA-1//-1//CDS//3329535140//4324//frame0
MKLPLARRLSKYHVMGYSKLSHRLFTSQSSKRPLRIVFGSCSDSTEDLSYWNTIHTRSPDIVLLMGDNVYGKRSSLEHQYEELVTQPYFRNLQNACQIYATIDDNDMMDPEGINRAKALRLFQETFQPTFAPCVSDDGSTGLYQHYSLDPKLNLLLLDTRTCADEWSLLGESQWKWLEDQMDQQTFNSNSLTVIVSPIQVLATGHPYECWYRYPDERTRFLDVISDHNVLLLSGDRHTSALYQATLDNSETQDKDLYEITSSSLTHTVPPGLLDGEDDPMRVSDFCYENNFGELSLERFYDEGIVQVGIYNAVTGVNIFSWELNLKKHNIQGQE